MTRKKVRLGWIKSDTARKASLKKRRAGLLKKVSELCILCDVIACAIIYSPNEAEPLTYPPNRAEVEEILLRFEQVPEMEKSRKMMNQESYLKERAGKHQDQLKKNLKKNREMQMNHFLHQIYRAAKPYLEFSRTELRGLLFYVEERWRESRRRMQFFHQATGEPLPPIPPHMPVGEGDFAQREAEATKWDLWFLELTRKAQIAAGNSGVDEDSDEMADASEMLGGGVQENEAALLQGGGLLNFGLPQPQLGHTTPYGVTEGTAGGYGFGAHQSVAEAVGGFGQAMILHQGDAGAGGHQFGVQAHDWNPQGMGTGLHVPILHQGVGGGNWTYSMNPHDQNLVGGQSGHAMMPLQGGTQGTAEAYAWATNTGFGTVFPNPYGDLGGSSGLYGAGQNWNAEGAGGSYTLMLTQGDDAGLNLQQGNTGGLGAGFGMTLPQGEGRSDIGGYGVELRQGSTGGTNIERQGTMLSLGDAGGNSFSANPTPEDPMNIEEPTDPWAQYYGIEGPGNTAQQPGEGDDAGNNFPS